MLRITGRVFLPQRDQGGTRRLAERRQQLSEGWRESGETLKRGECGVEGWWQLCDRQLPIERLASHAMNKLRKEPSQAISRTLAIATGAGHDGSRPHNNQELTQRVVQPKTSVEQYWAARALRAETALSVRDTHKLEVQHLRDSEETKRSVRLCQQKVPVDAVPTRSLSTERES